MMCLTFARCAIFMCVMLFGFIAFNSTQQTVLSKNPVAPLSVEMNTDDAPPMPKRTVQVNSIEQLKSAIEQAQPGDSIIVARGTYTLDGFININKKQGTATNPIVIRAEAVAGVTLDGKGSFNITKSAYIIIQGFKFTGSTARLGSNESYDQALTIKDSNNCRITRNLFQMKDAGKAYWTLITGTGDDHRIDRNEYRDKPSEGCFIVVYGAPEKMSLRTRIDRNYFHGQTFTGENGGECLRLGDSKRQNIDAFMKVEYNLFERNTGDVEVISNKTSSNVIRYNTLRANRGSIVLRHGDDNLVEGNFLLDGQNGIRFYGDKQRIIGNYFSGNDGTAAYSTIAVGNGSQADLANGENTYDQPHDCVVAFNTLVNNKINLVVGVRGDKNFPPVNLVVANNIIQGEVGKLIDIATAPVNATWQDNIVWGAAASGDTIPAKGFRRIDPLLAKDTDGVFRLKPSSPVFNSSSKSGNFLFLTANASSTTSTAKDGKAELARRPLRPADVGVNAL